MNTTPFWFNNRLPTFPELDRDLNVDVAVIGAGLTGITAAVLFREAGAKVALFDRQRCAAADTGHTTAHLTYVTDKRLQHLVKTFGQDCAKAFWDAGAVALDQIDSLVRGGGIDCGFEWVPGYLHAALGKNDPTASTPLE